MTNGNMETDVDGTRNENGNTDPDAGAGTESKVSGDVDRSSGGRFVVKYEDNDVLNMLAESAPEPLSAPEVAGEVGCARGTARNRLDSFVEEGIVGTKKLGARSRAYWLTSDGAESLGVAVY